MGAERGGVVVARPVVARASRFRWAERNWKFTVEQAAPAPHLARPEVRAALTDMC